MRVVAVIAQGAMGAGLARRLTERGAVVLTSLAGRSAASARRAAAAGMRDADPAGIAGADAILSVVPPAEARALAESLAPALAAAPRKPLYADCNAVSPETARGIAAVVEAAGAPFVDGGIIGGPPRADGYAPALYLSGAHAEALLALRGYGLDARVTPGPVGAASALKMAYAGITKGASALAAAMLLAAGRGGAAEALRAELAASQPELLAWFGRMLPGMPDKAWRWVGEMEEIADFAGPEAAPVYRAIARFYAGVAADRDGTAAALRASLGEG